MKADVAPVSRADILSANGPRRPRTGPLLFVPGRWKRVAFLKWLKRVHAWTRLWGALIFLLFGTSGFLLNHRESLKIDTGAPREVSMLDVRVAPGLIRTDAELDAWDKSTLAVHGKGRTPHVEAAGPVSILGRTLQRAAPLTRSFNLVDERVTVSTVPGSAVVNVKRNAAGLLAIIKNLHLKSGLGVAWILLIDTIAGARDDEPDRRAALVTASWRSAAGRGHCGKAAWCGRWRPPFPQLVS